MRHWHDSRPPRSLFQVAGLVFRVGSYARVESHGAWVGLGDEGGGLGSVKVVSASQLRSHRLVDYLT